MLLTELCTAKVEGNSFELVICMSAPAETDARFGLGKRAYRKSLWHQEHQEYKAGLLQNAAAQKLDLKCLATSLAVWL